MEARQPEQAVRFEPALESDIPEMTGVMTRAFDDDSRRFRGIPKGGPPGYDTGDFLRKWMPKGIAYKVVRSGGIIGCFIVFTDYPAAVNNVLGTVFIDPEHQNQGVGSRTLAFIHESFPASNWQLETPEWSTRNHHFYEKNGYRKISERFDAEAGYASWAFGRVEE